MIKPFRNEKESLSIGELTIENRLDRIDLYGSLAITKDKAGLQLANELKAQIDAVVEALQKESLPDHVAVMPAERVDNPFKS
jgi:hypothetical protein